VHVRDTLFGDLVNATARLNANRRTFDEIMRQFPTRRSENGVQHASDNLQAARKELNRTHNRLDDFLSRGILPEDLKRAAGQQKLAAMQSSARVAPLRADRITYSSEELSAEAGQAYELPSYNSVQVHRSFKARTFLNTPRLLVPSSNPTR
jgi:hypothetical protein